MTIASRFEFFLLKKHYCSRCGNLLSRKKVTQIFDENSEEAYHFRSLETGVGSGDVKLTTYCLECPNCLSTFTVKEQREAERYETNLYRKVHLSRTQQFRIEECSAESDRDESESK